MVKAPPRRSPGGGRAIKSTRASGRQGVLAAAAGVAETIEKVIEGLLEAITSKRALVSKMLIAPSTMNATTPVQACTIGRFNAFPALS